MATTIGSKPGPRRVRAVSRACVLAAAIAAAGPARATDDAAAARKSALDHYKAGDKAMHVPDWARAEQELKAAIDADPLNTLALVALGQTYMATKRYADALSAFERTRKTLEDQASAHARDAGHDELAREEQIRGLRDQLRQLQSGQVRSTNDDRLITQTEDALRVLEGQRERGDNAASVVPAALWLSIGSAHFRLGHNAEAEEAFKQAIQIEPKLGEAHNNLGVLYMLSGRFAEAEAELVLAEKAKFTVSPMLKQDLAARRAAAAGAAKSK